MLLEVRYTSTCEMTSNLAFLEELQVLEAIFCRDGEFTLHGINEREGSGTYSINTAINRPTSVSANSGGSSSVPTVSIKFDVSPDYPSSMPTISLSSESDHIKRRAIEGMKRDLHEYAKENLLGEPMAVHIVEWVREHAYEYADEEKSANKLQAEEEDELGISLLHLDHMRARNRYVRTLVAWCSELGIVGRIFFVDKLILVLLEGPAKKQKTQKVDVDSSGRSCKEKMMRVLSEVPSSNSPPWFNSFEVEDLSGLPELRAAFEAAGLQELYLQHVQPLHKHSSHAPVR